MFPCSLAGWSSFVDGLCRSTETVARKRASATTRTPTTMTSYTTDFISLCYVRRRDVGCRKPTVSLCSSALRRRGRRFRPSLFRVSLLPRVPDPLRHGTVLHPFNPLALERPAWRTRKATSLSGRQQPEIDISGRRVEKLSGGRGDRLYRFRFVRC